MIENARASAPNATDRNRVSGIPLSRRPQVLREAEAIRMRMDIAASAVPLPRKLPGRNRIASRLMHPWIHFVFLPQSGEYLQAVTQNSRPPNKNRHNVYFPPLVLGIAVRISFSERFLKDLSEHRRSERDFETSGRRMHRLWDALSGGQVS
jgi:hypothetical protein